MTKVKSVRERAQDTRVDKQQRAKKIAIQTLTTTTTITAAMMERNTDKKAFIYHIRATITYK